MGTSSVSLDSLLRWTLRISAWLSGFVMAALFLAGLFQLAMAVGYAFGVLDIGDEYPSAVVAGIKTAIKGLELFFLAPLPYVVIAAIRRHFEAAANDPLETRVRDELVAVKTFSLTLLFALVASALTEEALSGDGLTYESALSGSAFLLVLGAFILGLKRTIHQS